MDPSVTFEVKYLQQCEEYIVQLLSVKIAKSFHLHRSGSWEDISEWHDNTIW